MLVHKTQSNGRYRAAPQRNEPKSVNEPVGSAMYARTSQSLNTRRTDLGECPAGELSLEVDRVAVDAALPRRRAASTGSADRRRRRRRRLAGRRCRRPRTTRLASTSTSPCRRHRLSPAVPAHCTLIGAGRVSPRSHYITGVAYFGKF